MPFRFIRKGTIRFLIYSDSAELFGFGWPLRQRSSWVKGRLTSKVVFRQRSSSVKSRLPSKVVFHRRSSSSFGSFSFLGFSPECGIAKLSLSFVSSCWSTKMSSIIFHFELVHLNDLFYDEYLSRRYWRRDRCQRCPKILNICRTESYCTKIWGRISPGIFWCHRE